MQLLSAEAYPAMNIFLSSLHALGFLFLFLYYLSFGKKKSSGSCLKLPPGNIGWPILGESLDFISTLRKGCPEKLFNDRMKKFSPTQVLKISIHGEKMAVLDGPSGNKLLFANQNNFFTTWWPSSVRKLIFSGRPSGPQAHKIHTNLQEFLRPEALSRYVSLIQDMVTDHLQKDWIPKNELTVHPLSKKLVFSIVSRLFIGLEDAPQVAMLQDLFCEVTAGIFSVPFNFPGTPFYRANSASIQIKKRLIPIIEQKRSQLLSEEINLEKSRDVFSKLVLQTEEDGNFLSDVDIADHNFGIIVASHASSSILLTAILYYLADHPHVYARVFEEQMKISNSKAPEKALTWENIQQMKYSRNVVNEVLRIATPILGIFKYVLSDFTFGGCTIPKGWKICLSTHAIHRNKEFFSNPNMFEPSRFEGNGPTPFTFVPFEGRPRMCPGSELARLEALVAIHYMVTKFKWEKLFPDEKMLFNLDVVPEKGLPIRLFPHGN